MTRQIDPLELRSMIEAGKTYRQIAEHFNVSVSGVQQAVERIGLQKKTLSHKKFVHWTVMKPHLHSGPVTALRNLSKVAQGQSIPITKLNTALRWANRLNDAGLDIDYDPETGFYEKQAEDPSHIGMVLGEVETALEKESWY